MEFPQQIIPGRVTIVVPNYNQWQYIADALNSAMASTYQNIEVVVVDDASTEQPDPENDLRVRNRTKNPIPFLVYRHDRNLGLSEARNTGIKIARGEWILPLDADDKIHPEYIEKAIAASNRHNAGIVSSWVQLFGDEEQIKKPKETYTFDELYRGNKINCCSLFRKEMWHQLGGYDVTMRRGYEDYDFWLRAVAAEYEIYVIQEPLFMYRKHGDTMWKQVQPWREETLEYIRSKHKK